MLSLITLLPWAPLLTVMPSDGADARTEGSLAQPWRQGPVSLASLLSPVIGRVPQPTADKTAVCQKVILPARTEAAAQSATTTPRLPGLALTNAM